ncbi:ABC transporter ATP-binding protein [Marinimicrobium sp. C2-29]|uniref:ABC transporter ATP-binding protein n=1 Tax=Marinimicrobium sp. C2-29 TaxID=3139825 RepID=UPI00313921F2
MSEPETHILVENLSLSFGDMLVQQDLNFSINRGEIFVIMGGSGCGKSTLMKAMIGLKRPSCGEVFLDGEPVWGVSKGEGGSRGGEGESNRLARKYGTLFQSGALWSSMTLAENVTLALKQFTDLSDARVREIAEYKLMLVGLAGFEDFYPSEISGGMKKRAGLARAMALDPEILFCDEPSAGLDPLSAKRLDDLMLQLRDSLNTTFVIVTHELDSIFSIADRALFLDAESKTQLGVGSPDELRHDHPSARVRAFMNRGEVS